jgi:hypothetical protein
MFAEEKLDEISVMLEQLKLYETTLVHELKPRDTTNRVNFHNYIFQPVYDGEINTLSWFSFPVRLCFTYMWR